MDHHRTSSGARPNLPNLDVVPDFIAANLSSCVRFVSPERSPPWPPARPLLKPTGGRRGSNLKTPRIDRKSTRLNSSHGYISYAVFCLEKKKKYIIALTRVQ